eukprot:g33400.t1
MFYTAEEVNTLVVKLEKNVARQIATVDSAVKGVAAERDLLSTAEATRDLLLKAVKGEKEYLDQANFKWMPLFNLSLFAKSRSTVESRGRCNGAMPTSGLYALLQKARPGWSSKDLLKVYQKLQKVSITEPLALESFLAAAGERKLKPSTLQLLRLASRDPTRGHREAVRVEPLQPKRCFCGSCIRVPLCKPRGPSSQLLKLPSVGCSLPPLMPSKRRVMVPLPRIKRSAGEHHKGRNGLQSSNSVGHLRVPALPALVEPRDGGLRY